MKIDLYNVDSLEYIKSLPAKSIDAIITDPPYNILELKLDRKVDYKEYSKEFNRVLKDDAVIVMFGLGALYFKWVAYLLELGFNYRYEIIWDKVMKNGFLLAINKQHEDIVILTKGNYKINKIFIDVENLVWDTNTIISDVKQYISGAKSMKSAQELYDYLNTGKTILEKYSSERTFYGKTKDISRYASLYKKYSEGCLVPSILRIVNKHYKKGRKHPTEKPLNLIKILVDIVKKDTDDFTILDPFMGCGNIIQVCKQYGFNFIGCEIDKEYFEIAKQQLQEETLTQEAI